MKTHLSLSALAQELERQKEARADYVADTRKMTMLGGDEVHLDGLGEFGVNDHAHGQIASHTGVPKRFYDRLREQHADLLDHNVNALWRREPSKRLVRTLDGQARAYLSDRYRRRDNFELAEHILPVLSEIPDVQFASTALTDTRMYLKAVAPKTEAAVAVGDLVQAGVEITNSEVGAGALTVRPLIYRLICTNGMVVPDRTVRHFHLGSRLDGSGDTYEVFRDETIMADDEAFFMKVADLVRAAVSEATFLAVVEQMRKAMDPATEIKGDVPEAIVRLGERHKLTDDERSSVLTHLIKGGDITKYGVLNAVTRASQGLVDYDRCSELERMGGTILGTPPREWAALVQ